ncbi:MAG: acyltransferase domain-containing protein, partial [Planctomycetes bacterium]|nr:acyltransferase domain-containing protein [Planctomycetota bacterium]
MDMTDAILFPGQGAQSVGMGKAWADHSDAAREVFERASDALGFDLKLACWSGDQDVNRTDLAQPAIFTCSAACMAGLQEAGEAPAQLR